MRILLSYMFTNNVIELWLLQVKKVWYPGLDNHPQHDLAKKYMGTQYGGMIAFEMENGEAARKVCEVVEWLANDLDYCSLEYSPRCLQEKGR